MPMSTAQKFDRLQNITNIDILEYDLMKKEQYNSKITEFLYFYKVVNPLLNKVKGQTASMMRNKVNTIQSYADLSRAATRYEDMNLQNYTEMNTNELIMTNQENAEIFQELQEIPNKLQNPYIDIYHWAKGELFDVNALFIAVKERNKCVDAIKSLEQKKRDTQQDLADVAAGKKTLTTLFKNQSDAGDIANKVENYDREIDAMQKLTDLLTIYLCEKVLATFKREKLALYYRILSQIQIVEI